MEILVWILVVVAIIYAAHLLSWWIVYWTPASAWELERIREHCEKRPESQKYIREVLTYRNYLMRWDWHISFELSQKNQEGEEQRRQREAVAAIREVVK
jgi:hypothetical protein